ncbi:MAG TPA: hypothetical protein VLB76_07805 [Thermoanaerobaculia bacterium]|nr:hypothetical protein [Thermoanaerobaculia bacterium]
MRHHPSEELLLRFLRGETTRAETREVVRHLLAGCPECRAFTSSAWRAQEAQAMEGIKG